LENRPFAVTREKGLDDAVRRKKDGSPQRKQVNVRVPVDEVEANKQLAKDLGLSEQEFYRRGADALRKQTEEVTLREEAERRAAEQQHVRRQVLGLDASEPAAPETFEATESPSSTARPLWTPAEKREVRSVWTYYSPRPERLSANARRARSFMQFGSNRPRPVNELGLLRGKTGEIAREAWLKRLEEKD
jgi:hypothetical protein